MITCTYTNDTISGLLDKEEASKAKQKLEVLQLKLSK